MTTDRDPRIDPQPGDFVQDTKRNIVRKVVGRFGGDIRYKQEGQSGPNKLCWVTTWRAWCRKNKVEVIDD